MAQSQKTKIPPLEIPNSLAILMEVFSIESEAVAKTLIAKAFAAIYFEKEGKDISKMEVDEVYALIQSFEPSNFTESLYAAQMILSHMVGIRKLTQPCKDDQRLGLKLLRLSNDAIQRLEKRRIGSQQDKL
jgi:hypothetical protein